MRICLVLLGIVMVMAGCLPFKQAETYPTVGGNNTEVTQLVISPQVYVQPVQPPTVSESVTLPSNPNPYLISEPMLDIMSYFTIYTPRVGQTYWMPRYDMGNNVVGIVNEAGIPFWHGHIVAEVN
jgi:hypothetical protein